MYIGRGLAVVGGLAYTGIRIWKLVDLIRAIDQMKMEGRIAVKPSVQVYPESVFLGVSFSY